MMLPTVWNICFNMSSVTRGSRPPTYSARLFGSGAARRTNPPALCGDIICCPSFMGDSITPGIGFVLGGTSMVRGIAGGGMWDVPGAPAPGWGAEAPMAGGGGGGGGGWLAIFLFSIWKEMSCLGSGPLAGMCKGEVEAATNLGNGEWRTAKMRAEQRQRKARSLKSRKDRTMPREIHARDGEGWI